MSQIDVCVRRVPEHVHAALPQPSRIEADLLDAAFAPFTEKKQRAFDMVAKTVVGDVRGRGPRG